MTDPKPRDWALLFLLWLVLGGTVAGLCGCAPKEKPDPYIDKGERIAVRNAREADVYCDSDNDCIDTDPTTEDLCLKSGECVHLHECQKASDCTGGLPGAYVGCYEGLCVWYCGHCPDMDLSANNAVDAGDLAELLRRWGACHPLDPADWDGDRFCDANDLSVLLLAWD